MSRSRPPVPRLYTDGGGVVTRCTDPEEARRLLLAEYRAEIDDEADEDSFPLDRAIVTRGRIVNCLPGSYGDGEGWAWQFHPGTGRGSTPAIEWASR